MKPKVPCQNCEDRKAGCHSYCEKYINWKMEHEEQVNIIAQNKQIILDITSRKKAMIRKSKDKLKRK